MSDELVAVLLCEKMGWTYEQYKQHPWWFIEALKVKLRVESEHYERMQKKMNTKPY